MKRKLLKFAALALVLGSYSAAVAFGDPEEGSKRYKPTACVYPGQTPPGSICSVEDPNGPCDKKSNCSP